MAYPRRADLTSRGRGEHRVLPTRRPTHRRPTESFCRRQGTGEKDHMTPFETPESQGIDPNCIFCKIVSGELPSRRIYQDDRAVAFLDIAAWHRGHSLVVPIRHVTAVLTGGGSLAG